MRHRLAAVLLAGTLAGALAGCAGGGSDPDEGPTTLQPSDSPEPSQSSEPTDSPEPSGDATPVPASVQAAVDDLASDLDVPAAAIQAGPLEPVTWSNGALGCPEQGMSYTEALTDGYRVVLTVDGEQYHYHAGTDEELFYCADPIDPVSGDTEES